MGEVWRRGLIVMRYYKGDWTIGTRYFVQQVINHYIVAELTGTHVSDTATPQAPVSRYLTSSLSPFKRVPSATALSDVTDEAETIQLNDLALT